MLWLTGERIGNLFGVIRETLKRIKRKENDTKSKNLSGRTENVPKRDQRKGDEDKIQRTCWTTATCHGLRSSKVNRNNYNT